MRVALVALLAVAACAGPSSSSSALAAITERDWELVALGDRTNPRGAEGRPVTLRLDAASARAAGFAGCNRYSASYTLSGDRLTFGPAISTRMACAEGMELEGSFLAILPSVTTYRAADSSLVLHGPDGPVAGFRIP